MSLTFFHSPHSTACATHWVLEELGVPYEKVRLDLAKRDQDKPDYRALNPNGKVPTLVHDGTPIFESAAIAIYLGELYGDKNRVYPEPGPRRGEAMKWIVWTNVSLAASLAMYLEASSDRVPVEQHNEKLANVAKTEAENLFGILDAHLANRTWLLGDQFTIADAHLGSFVGYAGLIGFEIKRWKHVDAWLARGTKRPGFAVSMQP
jgi:glutathione S-transferase